MNFQYVRYNEYILLDLIILYLNRTNIIVSKTQRDLQYYQHLKIKTSRYLITGDLPLLICIVGHCTYKNILQFAHSNKLV